MKVAALSEVSWPEAETLRRADETNGFNKAIQSPKAKWTVCERPDLWNEDIAEG